MPAPVYARPLIIQPPADLRQQRPDLWRVSHELARQFANHKITVSEEFLQQVGQLLWQALGIDEAFEQARHAAGAQTLPMLLTSPDAAIQQLPWETLYHPTYGFLGKANGFTLARQRSAEVITNATTPERGPLRVLLFTALPDDVDAEHARLDIEEEQAQVLEALTPLVQEGMVRLEMPNDGRFSTLKQELQNFQPHLLFLSGHGKFLHPASREETPHALFLFEGENEGSNRVTESELATALLGSNVGCVVLSACESGMNASDNLTNGLAWRLNEIGIPYVIGMRESVLDRAGTLFVRHFCDAIARRDPVAVALQQGRQAITTPLVGSPWIQAEQSGLAEQSLGQWSLPILLIRTLDQPLIDWDFPPQPPPRPLPNQTLDTVRLPARFIGRRGELRQLQGRLRQGKLRQLLITGPGGQGKTALAGKLAQDLQDRGYRLFAWSARPENDWLTLELELELALSQASAERYSRLRDRMPNEEQRATLLLRLLLHENNNRLLLFFDNLESLQEVATQQINDARLQAWIQAAHSLAKDGLILLLTSRWRLPGWPESDHWPLQRASYGDFLQMARQQLPLGLLRQRDWLRRVYQTLHGNGRGLIFFAAALQGMDDQAEAAFLQALSQASAESQADMALAQVVSQQPAQAQTLLQRLRAFHTPVPLEGVLKLGLDLPEAGQLLQQLLAVSLVEPSFAHDLQANEYQLSPLVTDWLLKNGVTPLGPATLQAAAAYQQYLFRYERRTLSQAINTHMALMAAGMAEDAHRLALDWIVGWLSRAGLYKTLLDQWLPPLCKVTNAQIRGEALGQTGKQHLHLGNFTDALRYLEASLKIQQEIGDRAGEGTTLNNISQIFKARGDYETALRYLEASLKIRQEIGDIAGLCATLFNIGHIYYQKEEIQQAVSAWVNVYRLAKPIGLAQALNALAQLAESLGLPGGLAAWEDLSQRFPPDA